MLRIKRMKICYVVLLDILNLLLLRLIKYFEGLFIVIWKKFCNREYFFDILYWNRVIFLEEMNIYLLMVKFIIEKGIIEIRKYV